MEEYKQALLLREQGEFDKGRVLLEKAAELGCNYALRELENMYAYGGWGAYKDSEKASFLSDNYPDALKVIPLEKLQAIVKQGEFTIATELLGCSLMHIRRDKNIGQELLKVAADKGSAWSCYILITCDEYKVYKEYYLLKAHAQCMYEASMELFCLYWNKQKYKQAMEVFERTVDSEKYLNAQMKKIVSCECKYFVGRSVAVLRQEPPLSQSVLDTVPYYKRLYCCAQSATITWLCIAKKFNLYKDIARLIGKIIFASRETPSIWEKTGENKRVCLR